MRYICLGAVLLSLNFNMAFAVQDRPQGVKNSWQTLSEKLDPLADVEQIEVDNTRLQSYREHPGLWVNVTAGQSIAATAERYEADLDLVRKLNGLGEYQTGFPAAEWYFIPFGESYLKSLSSAGVPLRRKIKMQKGEYLWPIQGSRITSRIGNRWGRVHPGIDIAAGIGTIVVAGNDGEVITSGREGAYGICVILGHGNNVSSRYAHLSAAFVKPGDKIKKGQIVGLSGNTGRTTGPHLHFEVRSSNIVLDPEMFLPSFDESQESAMRFEEELRNTKFD